MARHILQHRRLQINDQLLRVLFDQFVGTPYSRWCNSATAPRAGDLFRNTNVFRLGEKPQRFFAAFATDAALFHSAERNA